MGIYGKSIITIIDFGSEEIRVLHGIRNDSGIPEVLAFASKKTNFSIMKGIPRNLPLVQVLLKKAMTEADQFLPEGISERKVFFIINGSDVESRQGESTVQNNVPGQPITQELVENGVDKAQSVALPPDHICIAAYDSYFVLDGINRESNPIGLTASRLGVSIHMITAKSSRIKEINDLLRSLGFEQDAEPIYAPIASAFGLLTEEERQNGTLLIDFGAETCSYVVISGDGIYLSGTIPLGTHHVSNDLSIGLELPFEYCEDFLKNKKMEELQKNSQNFLEYKSGKRNQPPRKIPLASFETIMTLRLEEIFTMVKEQVDKRMQSSISINEIVLCGGGAEIPMAQTALSNVFKTRVRPGIPSGFAGTINDPGMGKSCTAAIVGALKCAAEACGDSKNPVRNLRDKIAAVTEGIFGGAKTIRKWWEKK